MSLRAFRRGRLPGSPDRLGRVQAAAPGSAPRARRRARTTGCRRATGTTQRTTTRPTQPARTSAERGRSTARPARAQTVPTLDSIKRFLSPFEQTKLWQNPDYNQYHLNYEADLPNIQQNGGYSFGTLHDLDAAIQARYGPWSSLQQYVEEAQVQNYETQRAEFEAYIDHSTNAQAPSTGIVYWQLNKGWPTLLWDLYNYDFDQAGSYFGAKKANEPLHVLYAYDDGTVSVDNLGALAQSGLSVEAKVYAVDGQLLDDQTTSGISVTPQGVARGLLHPVVPAATTPPTPAQTYFVELLLTRAGEVVDRNVYWLSTQQDVVNWRKTRGNPQATMTRYGESHPAPVAGPRHRQRDCEHPSGHSRRRQRHRDRRDDHEHLDAADRGVLPAGRRAPRLALGRSGAAATTRCCRSCGATTT